MLRSALNSVFSPPQAVQRALRTSLACAALWVACVPAFAAFTDNANGTLTDTTTSLVWDRCALGRSGATCAVGSTSNFSWADALAQVSARNTASHLGFSDWRLPNRKELESLVSVGASAPATDTTAFPNTPMASLWTGTTSAASADSVWTVNFNTGALDLTLKSAGLGVRLVRSGPTLAAFDAMTPISGVCGSAHRTTPLVTTAPTANLCSVGAVGSVTAGNSAYTWSCEGTNGASGASCSASRGYTITPSVVAGAGNGSVNPNTAQVVAFNATPAFTLSANAGYVGSASGCGGAVSGNTYTTGATTADCTVSVSFSGTPGVCGSAANVARSLVPTANLCSAGTASAVGVGTSTWGWSCTSNTGGATASCTAPFAGTSGSGGVVGSIQAANTNNWQVKAADTSFVALPAPAPAGVTMTGGAVKVVLEGGTLGSTANVTLRFSSIPAGARLYKYGKPTGLADANQWFVFPATIDYAAGTVNYTLTDGQKGDNDWAVNGNIDDPVALGVGADTGIAGVPTLSEWALIILSGLIAVAALLTLRERKKTPISIANNSYQYCGKGDF